MVSPAGSTRAVFALAALLIASAHRAPYNTSAARQAGRINLHLVPHTHDDV
jgi:hypothetical protein